MKKHKGGRYEKGIDKHSYECDAYTYIHTYIQEGGLCSHLSNKEKRWNSYLTISPLSGGCDGN